MKPMHRARLGKMLSPVMAWLVTPAPLLAENPSGLYSSGPVLTCHTEQGTIEGGHDTIDGEVVVRPDAEAGQVPPVFASATVPAQVGISFGFLACGPVPKTPMSLTGTVTHPPMTFQGKTRTRQTWPIVLPARKDERPGEEICSFVGYLLEDEFELVLGEWVFSLWQGDTMLLTETIALVDRSEFSMKCSPR